MLESYSEYLKRRKAERLSKRAASKTPLTRPQVKALDRAAKSSKWSRKVLDESNHDPSKQVRLKELVTRIVALAQTFAGKSFYPYQVELAYRITESVLLHDGDVITALISRQSGKTECLSGIVSAIGVILPQLARKFPEDWKLNVTDDQGVYRGFRDGVKIGIYAPRQEQAEIMFNRIKMALESDLGEKILKELGLKAVESNGDRVRISNGTRILCQSASEQSKIEGETHHLLIVEEAQDVSDLKVRKSLHPMVSSLLGSIVKIGTASVRKCDFYTTIKANERQQILGGPKNHFFYPHTVTERYNSLYRRYVAKELSRLGADSDEFRMAYKNEWIFERGMFVTNEQLFSPKCAIMDGIWSIFHPRVSQLISGHSIIAAIDWGASSDSTVVTFLAVNWNSPLESGEYVARNGMGMEAYVCYEKHIVGWMEFQGDNYETQFHEIYARLKSMKGLAKIVMDSNTAGQPLFDRFKAVFTGTDVEVVPFNFQPRLKSDGYKSFYGDICAGRFTFPSNPLVRKTSAWRRFVGQMLDARKEYQNGLMKVAHPNEKGAHDDYPDSAMMAAWAANTPTWAGGFQVDSGNFFGNRSRFANK